MVIKENISNLKTLIQKNKFLKVIIMILPLIYPTIFVLNINGILSNELFNPIPLVWIGFYSSIILIYFLGLNLINILLVLINVCIILILMFISMMGGVGAPLSLTIKMILPFIPLHWL
ncbi:hypothetical protein GOQ27_01435 [Clostridium sp. D2Q-11]|uniref:Uncharacterized protein n=1 Tax=Anaeromonas frigoriresistens TaxID=2683708 RepID=A0A942UR89_9FIRM|nr:hypothetical protein [Anaeromonas frigoriresistens]MBS4537103.1 hypothetical protein [Anaeromonas frigoriresistens]